jgi:hypothetical protein
MKFLRLLTKVASGSRTEEVHPVDQGLAKRFIKQRLAEVFPELRGNPQALERAYRSLDMVATPGAIGEPEVVFRLHVHAEVEP